MHDVCRIVLTSQVFSDLCIFIFLRHFFHYRKRKFLEDECVVLEFEKEIGYFIYGYYVYVTPAVSLKHLYKNILQHFRKDFPLTYNRKIIKTGRLGQYTKWTKRIKRLMPNPVRLSCIPKVIWNRAHLCKIKTFLENTLSQGECRYFDLDHLGHMR